MDPHHCETPIQATSDVAIPEQAKQEVSDAARDAWREEYRNLMEVALNAYRDEYREIADAWRNMEMKAQGAVAIAGIFAAAVFAFVRDLEKEGGRSQKVLIVATMVFLICSVTFSILCLYVRRVTAPPLGETIDKKVRHLLSEMVSDNDMPARLQNLKSEQASLWRRVNVDASMANETKAKWLLAAQVSLIMAILMVGMLTVIILFT